MSDRFFFFYQSQKKRDFYFVIWILGLCNTYIVSYLGFLASFLQISSWWTWFYGQKVPLQQFPSALWWPFWLYGLEFLYPSPSLVPTLVLRRPWVFCCSFQFHVLSVHYHSFYVFSCPWTFFCSRPLCRLLNSQCEQIRSPGKFQSSLSSLSQSPELWWVGFFLLAASLSSSSSFSTASG